MRHAKHGQLPEAITQALPEGQTGKMRSQFAACRFSCLSEWQVLAGRFPSDSPQPLDDVLHTATQWQVLSGELTETVRHPPQYLACSPRMLDVNVYLTSFIPSNNCVVLVSC